jgi:hypothetical protein
MYFLENTAKPDFLELCLRACVPGQPCMSFIPIQVMQLSRSFVRAASAIHGDVFRATSLSIGHILSFTCICLLIRSPRQQQTLE